MARDDARTASRGESAGQTGERGGTPARRHESSPGALRRYDPMWPSSFWGASPFSLMRRMTDEMDRMFGDFGFGQGREWPQIEAFQRGNEFVVRADVPGITKDDLNVELNDDSLTISGERRHEETEDRDGFYRSERSYGSFHRTIPLPAGTIAESANARFKDGVLEVTMQAPPAATRGRRLEVKETK